MRHWSLAGIALALVALPGAPATAGMPYYESMKCPIGGESFQHMTTAAYTIFGQRADGMPYGSWQFPLALPRCPGNGLVIFETFSPDDLKRLEPLIASAEYRALLPVETDYFLAAWLMEKLGRDPLDVAWMVLQASWQADGNPALKTRYQSDYVERMRAIERRGDEFPWLVLQGRAVNGLRELGRFDEARTLLASLPVKSLDVAIPGERKGKSAEGADTVLNQEEIDLAENKRSFLRYFGKLEDLIRKRIAASDPLQMMPDGDAAMKCRKDRDSLSREDRDYCASDEMKKVMERTAP